jgi:diadenosine tetraphosphate (Ap4A) HIT family hydrolase
MRKPVGIFPSRQPREAQVRDHSEDSIVTGDCELCAPDEIVAQDDHAYVRYDSNSLARGHVIVVPKRHVAGYFEMTSAEKASIMNLLDTAKEIIDRQFAPDGYNIGVNVGKAAGQSRMHVHVHLIPRYRGDVVDPSGGIRCVLARKSG